MNTIDKDYIALIKDILENGVSDEDRTGTGSKSIFGKMLSFDMSTGSFPLLTTKKVWFPGIVHELLWFLAGDTNTKYLNDNDVRIWDEWADINGDLGPIYGKQWVDWSGTDQITKIINQLNNNPTSRRMIVSAWNVDDLDKMALVPCHYSFQLYSEKIKDNERMKSFNEYALKNNIDITGMSLTKAMEHYNFPKRKLSLMWNQRSVDVFLGLPFNIGSYALLLMMFAQVTNHSLGELKCSLGNVHIYDNHIKQVKEQINRTSFNLPTVELNKEIKSIFDFNFKDINIINYKSHKKISAPIAI